MADKNKLVKRTVTEEVYEAADAQDEIDRDEDEVDEDEEDKDEQDDAPSRSKKRR